MRRVARWFLLVWMCLGSVLMAQQQGAAQPSSVGDPEPYLLRLTTREVLVDVLVTDKRDHPIRDLSQEEFEVAEVTGHGKRPVEIASFRAVDAARELAPPAPHSGGFRVSIGGDCAARATFHYAISFHPDEEGWQSGYHDIEVRTMRPGVKVAYRPRYYVGARTARAKLLTVAQEAAELQRAACYHGDVPPSIGLTVRPVSTGTKDIMRFFVTVDADSLAFISVSTDNRRVQLDYGACTFDGHGRPLRYFNSAADRMLSSQEYGQAVVHGFPNLLELPQMADAAMMRVVVRDRATGNVGSIDLDLTSNSAPQSQAVSTADERLVQKISLDQMDRRISYNGTEPPYFPPPRGPIGSFGSIVPKPNSFCADVYDLPKDIVRIPTFWNLSSIGSVHTTSLDVPHQYFMDTGGIPGITSNSAWLGIDYHGVLWVENPGVYAFRLLVDDGAILRVDDQKVIDMNGVNSGKMRSGEINLSGGAHSIHVSYIQVPPTDVGLVLAVKAPGEREFRIFDLRAFQAPAVAVTAGASK